MLTKSCILIKQRSRRQKYDKSNCRPDNSCVIGFESVRYHKTAGYRYQKKQGQTAVLYAWCLFVGPWVADRLSTVFPYREYQSHQVSVRLQAALRRFFCVLHSGIGAQVLPDRLSFQ